MCYDILVYECIVIVVRVGLSVRSCTRTSHSMGFRSQTRQECNEALSHLPHFLLHNLSRTGCPPREVS